MSTLTGENGAEARGERINGGQEIRKSEEAVAVVKRWRRRFHTKRRLISVSVIDGASGAELCGDLGMDDGDFVRVIGCDSEELV